MNNQIPECPIDSAEMVLRTANKGPHEGEKFWGCSNFPKCKGILNTKDLSERDDLKLPLEEVAICSFDGTRYRKGSICPNVSKHSEVQTHRKYYFSNSMRKYIAKMKRFDNK